MEDDNNTASKLINDDIKEILDKAKEISDYGADGKQHTRMFNQFEAKALLDYITNLQQRVEYLERSNNRREDTIMGLRDEIVEYEDYKSRCEKAVEYIEDNWITYEDSKQFNEFDEELNVFINEIRILLNILNGRSDE